MKRGTHTYESECTETEHWFYTYVINGDVTNAVIVIFVEKKTIAFELIYSNIYIDFGSLDTWNFT